MIAEAAAAGVDANAPFLANGETPLMVAARTGSVDGVKLLLDAGANVDAKDTLRETTALIWAAEQRHAGRGRAAARARRRPKAASKVVIPKGARRRRRRRRRTCQRRSRPTPTPGAA